MSPLLNHTGLLWKKKTGVLQLCGGVIDKMHLHELHFSALHYQSIFYWTQESSSLGLWCTR